MEKNDHKEMNMQAYLKTMKKFDEKNEKGSLSLTLLRAALKRSETVFNNGSITHDQYHADIATFIKVQSSNDAVNNLVNKIKDAQSGLDKDEKDEVTQKYSKVMNVIKENEVTIPAVLERVATALVHLEDANVTEMPISEKMRLNRIAMLEIIKASKMKAMTSNELKKVIKRFEEMATTIVDPAYGSLKAQIDKAIIQTKYEELKDLPLPFNAITLTKDYNACRDAFHAGIINSTVFVNDVSRLSSIAFSGKDDPMKIIANEIKQEAIVLIEAETEKVQSLVVNGANEQEPVISVSKIFKMKGLQ